MREICMSGSMSGEGKPPAASRSRSSALPRLYSAPKRRRSLVEEESTRRFEGRSPGPARGRARPRHELTRHPGSPAPRRPGPDRRFDGPRSAGFSSVQLTIASTLAIQNLEKRGTPAKDAARDRRSGHHGDAREQRYNELVIEAGRQSILRCSTPTGSRSDTPAVKRTVRLRYPRRR